MHKHIFPCLTALLTIGSASAQWAQMSPTVSPAARTSAMMCSFGNQVVLFGGAAPPFSTHSDTWTYDGTTWTQLAPTTSPSGRLDANMVYDPIRNVVVMYGGGASGPFGGSSNDETWEFNGATWTQITTATTPGGLAIHGMAYDLIRQRVVVYGGSANSTFPIAESKTWEYDGKNWAAMAPTRSPGPLERPAMCFDSRLGKVVLFGGIDPQVGGTNTLWTYDGTTWAPLAIGGTLPAARTGSRMVHDSARKVTIMHGGMNFTNGQLMNETWELDASGWTETKINPTKARSAFCMAMDNYRGRPVIFSGQDASWTGLADTWEYGGSYREFGAGCAGKAGNPVLSGVGVPSIGSSFTVNLSNLDASVTAAAVLVGFSDTSWAGGALPLDLTPLGMTSCSLLVSPDVSVSVVASAGSASWVLPIPANATLFGLEFFNQGLVLEAGANAANAILTNGGAGVIGN